MEYKPPIHSNRKRNTLIILGSILLIAGIAAATFYTLRQVVKVDKSESSTAGITTPAEDSRQKAEKLFAEGDLKGAKASYEKALGEYESINNQSAAADMKMQIAIIEGMEKAPAAPQNTDHTRVRVETKQ